MTTTPKTTRPEPPAPFRLPGPPEREPDEKVTNADALHEPGQVLHLIRHFGRPESTLVKTDRFVTTGSDVELPSGSTLRLPELLIAFGVDPEAHVPRPREVSRAVGRQSLPWLRSEHAPPLTGVVT